MAFENKAAWLVTPKAPLVIKDAPYTKPGPKEIVIKNAAVAINPMDFVVQDASNLVSPWIKTPFIVGSDVAGTVVEVGSSITRFKVGDRVLGHAVSTDKRCNNSSEGGFQLFTILRTDLASKIPDGISFENACVLPLGLSTAACGLFMKDYLALDLPCQVKKEKGETVLIWGGSTSVGCNAIQLARAAGYQVVTTASPKNHAYLKSLGATEVYDYASPTVIEDVKISFKNRICVGAVSLGAGSFKACISIVGASKGNKFVAQGTYEKPEGGFPTKLWQWPGFIGSVGYENASAFILSKRLGVKTKFIWGSDTIEDDVGKAIYASFLEDALETGNFQPAPKPKTVGQGLEHLQEAMDLLQRGVSARKLIITLA